MDPTGQSQEGRRAEAPACPRCGYDQSGVVATWHESCPLAGTCSECGLAFPWGLVLGPWVRGPRWSVEHGARLTVGRWLRASMRGVLGRGLWRELEIAHAIGRGRLWFFVLSWLAIGHALMAAILVGAKVVVGFMVGYEVEWGPDLLAPYAGRLDIPVGPGGFAQLPVSPLFVLAYGPMVAMPLSLLLLHESIGKVGVRLVHILRGFAYTVPAGVLAVPLLGAALFGSAVFIEEALPPAIGNVIGLCVFPPMLLAWPIVLAARWHRFIRSYLVLPRARWITFALAIITVLATLVGLFKLAAIDPNV